MLDLQLCHALLGFGLRGDVDAEGGEMRGTFGVKLRVVTDIAVDIWLKRASARDSSLDDMPLTSVPFRRDGTQLNCHRMTRLLIVCKPMTISSKTAI